MVLQAIPLIFLSKFDLIHKPDSEYLYDNNLQINLASPLSSYLM